MKRKKVNPEQLFRKVAIAALFLFVLYSCNLILLIHLAECGNHHNSESCNLCIHYVINKNPATPVFSILLFNAVLASFAVLYFVDFYRHDDFNSLAIPRAPPF